ncbi:hypothetical protein J4558_24875 [Leptolyngbya sp. 15MV]|nr:hypothetical protein J4558_24875 [Leptolyngbya sp. 15MV]
MGADLALFLQLGVACLVAGATYALIGTGLNLVYGTLRLLNVAHGEMVVLGAYTALVTATVAGLPPLLALPIAMAFCGAIAWAGYALVFRRMFAATPGAAAGVSRPAAQMMATSASPCSRAEPARKAARAITARARRDASPCRPARHGW